jgi:hypothetical protein
MNNSELRTSTSKCLILRLVALLASFGLVRVRATVCVDSSCVTSTHPAAACSYIKNATENSIAPRFCRPSDLSGGGSCSLPDVSDTAAARYESQCAVGGEGSCRSFDAFSTAAGFFGLTDSAYQEPLACNANGVCTFQSRSPGDPCTLLAGCNSAELVCDPQRKVCTAAAPAPPGGAPCTRAADCEAGTFCFLNNRTCQPVSDPGASCSWLSRGE